MIISQILLWAAIAILAVMVAALARQVGVLHERIAPAGALSLHQNVNVGDTPTAMSFDSEQGEHITIGGKRKGRSQLVFFASPDCPVCKTLLPVLKSSARAERDWVDVILAGDGELKGYQKLQQQFGLETTPLILSEALGRAFGVSKLPYALLIDENGVLASMGLINSREHLESLFEAKERNVASLQDYLTQHNKRRG